MTTVRTGKTKGSNFEMDCEASLQQIYPDCFRTHERGYVMEYDLKADDNKIACECKRLKGITWNAVVSIYLNLCEVAPKDYKKYMLFQSNRQPCLVYDGKVIKLFKDEFGVDFIKHTPIQRRKRVKSK